MTRVKIIFILFILLLIIIPGNAKASANLFNCDDNENTPDLSTWHHQYKDRCYIEGSINPENENIETIESILSEMRKEPVLASFLLDKAKQLSIAFCIEYRADGCRGYFDYGLNLLAVRKKLDLPTKVIIFIHELRHVDQLSRGFKSSLDYDANEIIRLTYAIEADANAVLALYAWRLNKNGFPQVWDKLFELSQYSDIYEAFRDSIVTTDDELLASKNAFIQWYKSEWRTTEYYRNSLGGYLDMLDDTKLIQKYDLLPKNYFNNLCILPSGKNYNCHLTQEIKMKP